MSFVDMSGHEESQGWIHRRLVHQPLLAEIDGQQLSDLVTPVRAGGALSENAQLVDATITEGNPANHIELRILYVRRFRARNLAARPFSHVLTQFFDGVVKRTWSVGTREAEMVRAGGLGTSQITDKRCCTDKLKERRGRFWSILIAPAEHGYCRKEGVDRLLSIRFGFHSTIDNEGVGLTQVLLPEHKSFDRRISKTLKFIVLSCDEFI